MYTEKQLVGFGNFLLKRYNVQVYSNDGTNTPIYDRNVHHADIENWKHDNPEAAAQAVQQTMFQLDELVGLSWYETMPTVPCRIHQVHISQYRTTYDLIIKTGEKKGEEARCYNVDERFLSKLPA